MGRWASTDLISAAIFGDGVGRRQLIEAIWPGCFRLATAVVGDWNLAQDAAQESCIIVHRKIASLRNAAAFDAWLYRIVFRECGRIRRRQAPQPESIYAHTFGSDATTSMDVWRALTGLAIPLRTVTVLFYFDDLKTEEIAHILRIPHSTVRTRLARARDHLRPLLANYSSTATPSFDEVTEHVF